ncbi:tyrosine-type recombinase/integrase [Chlorogloea sp. CCALA 695]|uniref:tyrosine-type recombinase/integrase n=1 Tax=Chlorogloea sp. CCALA 695 TaxID=2107693 RepID=UPI0018EDD4A7|nr:tyrosine-type recombinase/integrase [Chlorogloea sp. CCALA 695]
MPQLPHHPIILPITIVPFDGGREKTGRRTSSETLSDLRHWQIEEFLRQTGKADNTQRAYKRQLKNFSSWCNKSWLDITPSDIGKYRRDLLQQELKLASINHALNTLRAFYQWLRRSNGYPVNQPLPTDAIGLERVEEAQDLHIEKEDLADIWHALSTEGATRIRDRAIVALLSHGLRATELSVLNVNHWNGKRLTVHRSKGQNVSEIPLSKEARQYLEAYFDWRQQEGAAFILTPDSPMFLCQDPKHRGERLGYKGLYRMVKQLGAIAQVDNIRPHRFRHQFGTSITRKGVDPMYGKELMGIKSDRVYGRYTQGALKQDAESRLFASDWGR